MSVEVMAAAWKASLPPSEKLVLLAIADHANDEDHTAWPSLTHLAKKTGLDRSSVWRVIERLIEVGLLARVGKRAKCTLYRLQLNNQQLRSATSCAPQTVAQSNPTSCTGQTEMVAQRNMEPLRNHQEPSESTPAKKTGRKKSKITMGEFLEQCRRQGEQQIPENDPVLRYATETGIPHPYVELAWMEFVERHLQTDKTYRDWRQAFRNCVRANWYRLWWVDAEGRYQLTTTGRQADKKHRVAA